MARVQPPPADLEWEELEEGEGEEGRGEEGDKSEGVKGEEVERGTDSRDGSHGGLHV